MIKAVLLDVDNTLLDFNLNASASMKSAFNECGLEYKEEYFPVFKRINDALWVGIEKGEITREQLKKTRFPSILKELGLSGDSARIETLFRKGLGEYAFMVDGAEDLLEYLYKKYRLFVASNAIYEVQMNRLNSTGMIKYFEKLFISEKMGHDKPTKEFFDICFKEMGNLKREEVFMIGDSLTADIGGAKEYGLKTIWFNIDKKPFNSALADFTVEKLSDIKGIL
jgi:YjjG family noncanonical pyrimidine nucleotidase